MASPLSEVNLSDYLDDSERAKAFHCLPVPGKVCIVDHLPRCVFCVSDTPLPGVFNFATRMGPWANGCEQHYLLYRASEGLGVGKAQLWLEGPSDG
jgi:hypothetical protein